MKKSKLTKTIALLLALAALLAMSACGGAPETGNTSEPASDSTPADAADNASPENPPEGDSSEASADRDTFIYAMPSDTGNVLNYLTADNREQLTALSMINDGLFTLMPDGSYKFCVAESFDPSEDGLTYTAKIKPDLKWSDGEPLTVDDVIFTFETFMDNDASGSLTVGGEPVAVNKVDETTVEFVLPGVLASMPSSVAEVPMLAKHIFEGKSSMDMDLTDPDAVVGCGPYKFAEYKSGEYLRMVRNENYAGEPAKIETAVIQFISNDETAKAALQRGDVDAWIALATQMDGLEDFTVTPYSEGRVAYVRLNRVSPNMQDENLRKAIFYALNREEIMVAAYSAPEYVTLSYAFLPFSNGSYTEDLEKYDQDVEKAKELADGSGVTDLKICYIGTDAAQTAIATVMQAELKAIGINLELCGVEQAAYQATAYDNEDTTYDMYLGGYVVGTDPDGYSGLFITGGMINISDPELDKLFDEGKSTTDPAARKEAYIKAQQLVAGSALYYPFGTNLRILVTNPDLKGLEEAALVPVTTFEDISFLYY